MKTKKSRFEIILNCIWAVSLILSAACIWKAVFFIDTLVAPLLEYVNPFSCTIIYMIIFLLFLAGLFFCLHKIKMFLDKKIDEERASDK